MSRVVTDVVGKKNDFQKSGSGMPVTAESSALPSPR